MIRVSKFRRASNAHWYIRYWLGGRVIDESARTLNDGAAEVFRLKREMELNAGIQPLRHAHVEELVPVCLETLPPQTSRKHLHEVNRVLHAFLQLSGRKRADGSFRLPTQHLTPALIDIYVRRRAASGLYTGQCKDRRRRRIVRKMPVSNVTLRTELRYLSGFMNWCCRQRPAFLRENPIATTRIGGFRIGDSQRSASPIATSPPY